jgi:hypothetical protein
MPLLLDHGALLDCQPRQLKAGQPLLVVPPFLGLFDGSHEEESLELGLELGLEPEFAHHLDGAQDPRFNTRFNNNRSPFSPQQQNRLPPIQEPFTETFDAPVKQVPPSGQPRPTTPGTSPTDGEMMDRNPVPPASHVDQLVPPVVVLLRPHLKSHLRSHHEME